MPIRLSVLDQSPIRRGATPAQAIQESIELAQECDRLGYHRYWVAEHHSSEGLAGAAPEILITRLASATKSLRIGSGGVMLSHYSPLKVAEQWRVLEAMFPGRIDLGIGRAPGSDYVTSRALAHGPGALGIEEFPRQINDLLDYLRDAVPDGHPFAGVSAQPRGQTMPEMWLLGSSDQSAAYAAHFGCAFSFAHFITDRQGPEIMAAYRRSFRPSSWGGTADGSIGVSVTCAPTAAEADRLAKSRDLSRLRLEQGGMGPVPTIEEAEAYPYSYEEKVRIAHNRERQAIGDPAQCKAQLLELGTRYGVDEFVVVTITHDPAARLRSYALLAKEFGLEARA
jgi:luciferase family oxidoreductase group 1